MPKRSNATPTQENATDDGAGGQLATYTCPKHRIARAHVVVICTTAPSAAAQCVAQYKTGDKVTVIGMLPAPIAIGAKIDVDNVWMGEKDSVVVLMSIPGTANLGKFDATVFKIESGNEERGPNYNG